MKLKKKICRNLIAFVIVTLLLDLLFMNISNAETIKRIDFSNINWNSVVKIGFNSNEDGAGNNDYWLAGDPRADNIYCINHSLGIDSDTANKYTLKTHIRIEGNDSWVVNGDGSIANSVYNGQVAFILRIS